MRIDAKWSALFAVAVGLGAALFPGCQSQRTDPADAKGSACTSCHGDASRKGTELARAAPPSDTLGNSKPSFPGVGAHQFHLVASETHGAVPCTECHVVPTAVESKGHADDAAPAELVFGDLAKLGDRNPVYDTEKLSCSNTYCHRAATPDWTSPRDSQAACGSCHSLPPPAPHPQSPSCENCHGEVIGPNGFIKPELHVDGTVQRGPSSCDACHGSNGKPAPPKDLSGNTAVTALGVGAHQVHLAGGDVSRALACGECHTVPKAEGDPGHLDDALPAEVMFTGVATSKGRTPAWDRGLRTCNDSWCHSPSAPQPSPEWVSDQGRLSCTGCHAAPPPVPHPQMSDCSLCHGAVVNDDDTSIKDRSRHVDGVVDVAVPIPCNACHGGVNPAPPKDLAGNTATTFPGVGAHQAHVVGSGLARPVPCADCHVTPTNATDPGHMDTIGPAEVIFGGAAISNGANPSYVSGSCQKSWCHGEFPAAKPSGAATPSPVWTKVDGTQAQCGGCHSLPPPPPHVVNYSCSICHQNIDASLKFTKPDTHVDGKVTFAP